MSGDRGTAPEYQAIEATVAGSGAIPEPGSGVAFEVAEGGRGLVIALELSAAQLDRMDAPQAKIGEIIRWADAIHRRADRAIFEAHGLALADLVFLAPGALPGGDDGQIDRAALRSRYLAGTLSRGPGPLRRSLQAVLSVPPDTTPGELARRFGQRETARIVSQFRTAVTWRTLLAEGSRTSADLAELLGWVESLLTRRVLVETPPCAGVRDEGMAGATMLRRPRSADLYLMFTGIGQQLGIPIVEFLTKTGLVSRNVVVLRDRRAVSYQEGISADLPSFEALLAWIDGCASALAPRRRLCLGSSMGAYAAIAAGHHLQAEQVWALGLPYPRLQTPERGPNADLPALLRRHNGVTRYHLLYCHGHAADRAAAEALGDLPGVVLHPQPGQVHHVAQVLIDSGKLEGLFPPGLYHGSDGPAAPDLVAIDDVLGLLRPVIGAAAAALDRTSTLEGLLDSFGLVALLSSAEQTLGLRLDPGDLTDDDFGTPEAIASFLNRQLNRAATPALAGGQG
jgi:acyl carrier protein